MDNRPVPLGRDELATTLLHMLSGVITGNTPDGFIEFLAPRIEDPDGDFMVLACYQVGQDTRTVGFLAPDAQPADLRLDG